MIRRPPRSTLDRSSAASDVYKRQGWRLDRSEWEAMLRTTLELAAPPRVIAGIERPTTDEVIELARIARRMGIGAIMLTSPFGPEVDQMATVSYTHLTLPTSDLV